MNGLMEIHPDAFKFPSGYNETRPYMSWSQEARVLSTFSDSSLWESPTKNNTVHQNCWKWQMCFTKNILLNIGCYHHWKSVLP